MITTEAAEILASAIRDAFGAPKDNNADPRFLEGIAIALGISADSPTPTVAHSLASIAESLATIAEKLDI